MEGHSNNKIDLSKYMETNDKEEDAFGNWDDIELPENGLSLNSLGRKDSIVTTSTEQLRGDQSDYSDGFSNSATPQPLPLHTTSIDSVSRFLTNYSGPGTVTRLSGSKRSVSSEHSDWDDDIVIPQNGFPTKPKNHSYTADLDAFFGGEKDPGPSRASTFSRFSSLNSVEEEKFEEGDFKFPDGKLKLQLSPHTHDIPLELNFDGDEMDGELSSEFNNSNSFKQKPFPPITPESSTEHWDDVAFPDSMESLKLVQRKPYRPLVREENWLEDLEIPNDNVFTLKAEQNRLLKRKNVTPAARILTRNTIKLDLYNLPNMSSPPGPSSVPYSRKALRQKNSNDNFSKRILDTKERTILNIIPSPRTFQSFSPSSIQSNVKPLVRSKPKFYGDGTELDEFDNLPVPSEPESRSSRNSLKFQRLNPPKTEGMRESYSNLLSHFSEIEVVKQVTKTSNSKGKPHLIRNLNSLKEERVVGEMRYNPRTQTWEGNNQALKDFDTVSPPRPALITNLGGSKKPRRVGNMIFDPELLKWCSIVEEEDPFADIPDLVTADPEIKPDRKSQASGDSFYLNANFIDSMYDAERQHKQFMSRWNNDTTRSKGKQTDQGQIYDHLFDIRNFPTDF